MPPAPPPLPPRLPARVLQHRSIWRLRLPPQRLWLGLLLALGFSAALLAAAPAAHAAWGQALLSAVQALGLDGHFEAVAYGGELLAVNGPLLMPAVAEPGLAALAVHALLALAAWVGAPRLPDAARPATYLLRLAALIHGAAVLFFAFWPQAFPHSVHGHAVNLLHQGWLLMLALPWLHLCTWYLMPFSLLQHAALTLLSLAWLALLVPLLAASHVALLSVLGLVAMPLLHLLFGVAVPVIGLVGLYGWAMSWRDPAEAALEEAP